MTGGFHERSCIGPAFLNDCDALFGGFFGLGVDSIPQVDRYSCICHAVEMFYVYSRAICLLTECDKLCCFVPFLVFSLMLNFRWERDSGNRDRNYLNLF